MEQTLIILKHNSGISAMLAGRLRRRRRLAEPLNSWPSCMPPQYSAISSRMVMPAGASLTPGSLTRPDTEKDRKPLRSWRPNDVNQETPCSTMSRIQYSVSTFCSSVGRPNRPTCAT